MKPKTPPKFPADSLLQWSAPTQVHYHRTKRWYAGAAGFLLLCLLYGIWTNAWSFLIVMVLLTGLYVMQHRKEPPKKTIAITENGFQLEDRYTSWVECEGFWMLQGPDYVELHILRKKGLGREAVILLGPMEPQLVREVLLHFIPEFTEQGERVLDMISRILKI